MSRLLGLALLVFPQHSNDPVTLEQRAQAMRFSFREHRKVCRKGCARTMTIVGTDDQRPDLLCRRGQAIVEELGSILHDLAGKLGESDAARFEHPYLIEQATGQRAEDDPE